MNGSGLAKFEVGVDRYGYGSVIINGEEVSEKIMAIHIDSAAGQPTVLVVQMRPGAQGTFSGEGVVQVMTPTDIDSVLAALDANEIDGEASNRLGWGDEGNLTSVIIEVIREKIRAAQS